MYAHVHMLGSTLIIISKTNLNFQEAIIIKALWDSISVIFLKMELVCFNCARPHIWVSLK